ncbi:MAG: DUF1294 domain-containing protein [Dorea sp.]
MTEIVWIYLIAVNLVAFAMYGSDKRKAKKNQWRIPEATLLGVALIGGSVGALLGMKVFRHKTKHWKFKIMVPLFLVLHLAMGICFVIM